MKTTALLIVAVALASTVSAGAAALQPATRIDGLALAKAQPQPVIVEVKPLHDAGGLTALSADGYAINVSYTEAIQRYLMTGGYTVVQPGPKVRPAYTVEGDLSHLSVDNAGNGPYLCVLRLFSENGMHTLVGQWAGVAQSLRYLTANLNETEGVDSEGLLGELGGKIDEAIRASSDTTGASTFAAIVDVASQPDLIDAIAVPDVPNATPTAVAPASTTATQPQSPTAGQITAGSKYRLQIRSTEPGTVVLIGLGASGEPVKIAIPDDAHAIALAAGASVTAPVDVPLVAQDVTAPVDVKIVVLERRTSVIPPDSSPESDLPVRVLLGTTPSPSPTLADLDVSHLLRRILADPPHTWIAHTVTLHVVPKV